MHRSPTVHRKSPLRGRAALQRDAYLHHRTLKGVLCVLTVALLSACANPLLRQARHDCDPESLQLFPVVLQPQRVSEPVMMQVPDGSQHCITEAVRQGDRATAVTRCVPNYTLQTRWVDRWVNVDLNAKERSIWHERCVQQLCVQRVGNTSCEPPAPITPTPADAPQPTR